MTQAKHTVVLADGEHTLVWNMNAKIALKQQTGINVFSAKALSDYLRSISRVEFEEEATDEEGRPKVKDIIIEAERLRELVWAMLLDENTKGWEQEQTLTVQKVGALLPADDLNEVLEAVLLTFNAAQPEAKKGKDRPFAEGARARS